MSLHPTPYFERRLLDLRALSPATADLAERIASDLKPGVLSTSSDTLEAQLMDHLQEVAQQQARCVTRLWDWLCSSGHEVFGGQGHAVTFQVVDAQKILAPRKLRVN